MTLFFLILFVISVFIFMISKIFSSKCDVKGKELVRTQEDSLMKVDQPQSIPPELPEI